jgi:hypothetical protein
MLHQMHLSFQHQLLHYHQLRQLLPLLMALLMLLLSPQLARHQSSASSLVPIAAQHQCAQQQHFVRTIERLVQNHRSKSLKPMFALADVTIMLLYAPISRAQCMEAMTCFAHVCANCINSSASSM